MTHEKTALGAWRRPTGRVRDVARRGVVAGLGLAAALAPQSALAETWVKGRLEGTNTLVNAVLEESANKDNHRYHFREDSAASSEQAKKLTPFLPKELCVVALT